MMYLLIPIVMGLTNPVYEIYDFDKRSSLTSWRVIDDVVMGGRSSGMFLLDDEGHGVFQGDVSLENNGGFSSVRHKCDVLVDQDMNTLRLKIKGDGKVYQLRIKNDLRNRYSYAYDFQTTGSWETIEVPLAELYPIFRGRKLNYESFGHDRIEEIGFLIANKRNESFQLKIDKIELIP
jgi:hypothetical protein